MMVISIAEETGVKGLIDQKSIWSFKVLIECHIVDVIVVIVVYVIHMRSLNYCYGMRGRVGTHWFEG